MVSGYRVTILLFSPRERTSKSIKLIFTFLDVLLLDFKVNVQVDLFSSKEKEEMEIFVY